jgi:hypothetical protein
MKTDAAKPHPLCVLSFEVVVDNLIEAPFIALVRVFPRSLGSVAGSLGEEADKLIEFTFNARGDIAPSSLKILIGIFSDHLADVKGDIITQVGIYVAKIESAAVDDKIKVRQIIIFCSIGLQPTVF